METLQAPVTTSMASMARVRRIDLDVEAIVTEAFDAHAARLKAFATHAVRDGKADADDLVQETFLRLIRELKAGSVPDNIAAWLFTVCSRLIISRGRRRSVADRMKSLFVNRDVAPSPEERAIRNDESAHLNRGLHALSSDARIALLLAAAGYSSSEIGSAIGRSPGATLTLICRSRLRLRELLASAEDQR
jgi:RNA polymerase sigma-70 factor (ECF subfamily)